MRKQRSSLGVVRRGLSPSQALDSPNLGAHKGGRENTAAPKVERRRHLSETIGVVLIVTVIAWVALIWVAVAHADDFICRQAVCTGTPSGDFIEGDDHANTIRGKAGADHLFGERGWDTLEGGRGWDELDGGYGQDLLVGGSGDDIITATGDRGKPDVIICGHGYDAVFYKKGVDTLLDPEKCEEKVWS